MKRFILLALCLSMLGCATPPAVRYLSQEQLQTQEAFGVSLKAYLDVMLRFAEAQMQAADQQIDDLTRQIEARYTSLAERQLERAATPELRHEVLARLAENIRRDVATAHTQKARIAVLISKLREKNQEMLSAYAAIVEAQRRLNEYIQMKKMDEVMVDEALGRIKINREKMNQTVTEVVNITEDIRKLMELWK
jgi:chromosome segregation ATPase